MIRVGITEVALLAYRDNGIWRGLAIDLHTALAEALHVDLILEPLPDQQLIPALRGGRIDAILTTQSQTDLNAWRLAISHPLLHLGQIAFVHERDSQHLGRVLDLITSAIPIGFLQGSSASHFVHSYCLRAQRIPIPTIEIALMALRRGLIRVFILDALQAWAIMADPKNHDIVAFLPALTDEPLVWAVREQDTIFLKNINAIIRDWYTSGMINQLIAQSVPLRIEIQPRQ
jgi:ABC-type amino acid transport substrate-binding protein